MEKGSLEQFNDRWIEKEKNEDSAVISYKVSRDEVMDILKDIQGKIEIHDTQQPKDPTNWGYTLIPRLTRTSEIKWRTANCKYLL